MKRIRCPKCDEVITFDETLYEPGRILVFQCPECNKQFKIRMPQPKLKVEDEEQAPFYGKLIVLENAFHFKQEIYLQEGENIIGRQVKGSKANALIKTVDPSIDTTHCIITVKLRKGKEPLYILRDAPSNTGTFLQNEILGDKEQAYIHDGDIITIGATTMIFRLKEEEEEE